MSYQSALLLCLILGFFGIGSAINCTNYNPDVCQPDAIEYCFTNGQTIVGTCEAKNMVCNGSYIIDENFDACTPKNAFNCTDHSEAAPCLPDLEEYCFTNGEKVTGSCEAKNKVCLDELTIDTSGVSCVTTVDCSNVDQDTLCRPDMTSFCLSDGRTIKGYCEATKLACSDGLKLDPTKQACENPLSCTDYDASKECTSSDTTVYCLSDGNVRTGFCNAIKAVCGDGLTLKTDQSECSSVAHLIPTIFLTFISVIILLISY